MRKKGNWFDELKAKKSKPGMTKSNEMEHQAGRRGKPINSTPFLFSRASEMKKWNWS